MTITGRATLAMIHITAEDTWYRTWAWFHSHPDAQFAYWGRDEFLSDKADDKEKEEFIKRHPEINNLNDHTTVHILNDQIILATFCPRLKEGIKEMYNEGIIWEVTDGVHWLIEPDEDNYMIILSKTETES